MLMLISWYSGYVNNLSSQNFTHISHQTTWGRSEDKILAIEYNATNPFTFVLNYDQKVSHLYNFLLRKWPQECDRNHQKCKPLYRKKHFWPKRVISVGFYDRMALVEDRMVGEDYVILSHCWGKPTEEEAKTFCTTPENYRDRLQGFSLEKLPKTFQHAVQVTRMLGKKYLWIDAICIIQGPDGDWKQEARNMEDAYACAFVTIAATSACGWQEGFLKSAAESSDVKQKKICNCDFSKDVDSGNLGQRAWVLQERVLSRRTLHFTAKHLYWECGVGVRCENFTKLDPPYGKEYFVLDPNFPHRLSHSEYNRAAPCIQSLFKSFSQSGLTVQSDREVAIFSLMDRMRHSMMTDVRFGILRCFINPLLLWKRTRGNRTDLIDYGGRKVPSWSWMAYPGGIDFISDGTRSLMIPKFAELDFSLHEDKLTARVRQFKDCQIGKTALSRTKKAVSSLFDSEGQEGRHFAILTKGALGLDKQVGEVWLDVADRNGFQHCVLVGMPYDIKTSAAQKTYYFLLVRKVPDGTDYERIGVGHVGSLYVSKTGDEMAELR